MEVITKFLETYNYKFKAGVFNPNDNDDILLLEQILTQLNEQNTETPDQSILDLISTQLRPNSRTNIIHDDYQKGKAKGYDEIKYSRVVRPQGTKKNLDHIIYFQGIPAGTNGSAMRTAIKNELDKHYTKDFRFIIKKEILSSVSEGSIITNTDMKEGLVQMFFNMLTKDLKGDGFSIETKFSGTGDVADKQIKDVVNLMISGTALNGDYVGGMDDASKADIEHLLLQIHTYEGTMPSDSISGLKEKLNDPLSIAKRIRESYPTAGEGSLIRGDGEFKNARTRAIEALKADYTGTGIEKPDKWNPGDIYLKLGSPSIPSLGEMKKKNNLDPLSILNALFVDTWGGTTSTDVATDGNVTAGFVSISLKSEDAQLGRAKDFANTGEVKDLEIDVDGEKKTITTTFNLTDKEEKDPDKYIEKYREELKKLLKTSEFELPGTWNTPSVTPSNSKYKMIKLKSLKVLHQFIVGSKARAKLSPAEALEALAANSNTTHEYNPTFFKLTGRKNGEMAKKPTRTSRGTEVARDAEDKIQIIDANDIGMVVVHVTLNFLEGEGDKKAIVYHKETKMDFRTSGGDVGIQAQLVSRTESKRFIEDIYDSVEWDKENEHIFPFPEDKNVKTKRNWSLSAESIKKRPELVKSKDYEIEIIEPDENDQLDNTSKTKKYQIKITLKEEE